MSRPDPQALHLVQPLVDVVWHPSGTGYQPPRSSRAIGLAGTAAMFGGALAVLLWIPNAPIARLRPAAPLAITFDLAPTPVAPPTTPVDVPPGPLQHEQEASDAAKPKTDPELTPIPSPVVLSLPSGSGPADQTADQSSSDARAVDRTTAPPAIPTPGATVAARVTSAATEQAAHANWQSELIGHLKPFLRYPRQAQSGRQEGVALVAITVDRQGNVLGARLERASGYPLLDAEATAMVRRGSPVPPPTADIPGDPVSVTIPIQFSLRR